MRILVVTSNFPPEIGSSSHIYHDLVHALAGRGHEVTVLTSFPRPFNLEPGRDLSTVPEDETANGVRVVRVRHHAQRDSILARGMEHFRLPGIYFEAYKRLGVRFDAALLHIPPLPLHLFARRLKRRDGTPSILNFQDFHPQELTDVGVVKNPLAIKALEWLERRAYRTADAITVLSPGGVDYVVARGGEPARVHALYNAAPLAKLDGPGRTGAFRKAEGIPESATLVSYAGILSPFQGLDHVLDAAKLLKDEKDVVVYVVGDGMVKDHLARRIETEGIANVRLRPYLPRERYYELVADTDVALITLDSRMRAPCIPGKTVNLLGMRKAVAACVPAQSATATLLRDSGCGVVVTPGAPQELADAIRKLASDAAGRARMGEAGRRFVEANMDLAKAAASYERLMQDLAKGGNT